MLANLQRRILSGFADSARHPADRILRQRCFRARAAHPILASMNPRTPPGTLTLYLVPDGRLIAGRLLRLFARLQNVACIGVGPFGERTLSTIEAVQPNVLVADIGIGRPNALHRVRLLRKAAGTGTFVLLAQASAAATRQRYLDAGADACLDITAEFDMVAQMLRRLARSPPGHQADARGIADALAEASH